MITAAWRRSTACDSDSRNVRKCVTQIIYLGPLPSASRRAGRGVRLSERGGEGARERRARRFATKLACRRASRPRSCGASKKSFTENFVARERRALRFATERKFHGSQEAMETHAVLLVRGHGGPGGGIGGGAARVCPPARAVSCVGPGAAAGAPSRCAVGFSSFQPSPWKRSAAARSGFHHSSQAPGNGRIHRDNRETDALIVITRNGRIDRDNRGQPGGRDRRQGVGAASQVIPNPDAERTGAEHEKPIGSSFQEEMRGRELRDILKKLRQVCAGGVLTLLTEREKQ